jgi:hypothetical protein
MSTTITVEDLWKMFKETNQLIREQAHATERRFQEYERLLQTIQQETDRRFQQNERLIQALRQEAKPRSHEADWHLPELDRRLRNPLGDFIQERVAPAAVRLFQERGIEVHFLSRNLQGERAGQVLQVDLMVSNGQIAVLIEVRSALSVDDVNEHLERLSRFKSVVPGYADARIMGAVAAMVIPDHVACYACQCGLFVLGQSGDTMRLLNDDHFQPKIW